MLELRDLRKSFGKNRAVDGLTLEVRRGEVFGLLGPNGAGKTTTVSMTVGMLSPDSGAVSIGGNGSPVNRRVRAMVGVAPQSLAIYDELTARENMAFFVSLYGFTGRRGRERAAWALDFVGLVDRADDRVSTYSGGMKRRLNMAAAVLHDPALVLFDEPTVGVDPQSRNSIFDNILRLRDSGKTIVYTTHYMEEAQRLCDRVGIVDKGKLLALDTVPNLLKAHGGKRTVIAETDGGPIRIETDDPLAELNALHQSRRVDHFSVEEPDLEHVFLHLTGRHLRDA